MSKAKHIGAIAALAMLSGCANAQEASVATNMQTNSATTTVQRAQAATFAVAGDRSLLKLSGTVRSVTPNSFQLATAGETVTVEMDDWDWFKEGKQLKTGDQVVVTGRVDLDAWEKKKLEASSVYVRNAGITVWANGGDEEDLAAALMLVDTTSSALGRVTAVEGTEFTIGGQTGPVRVDVSKLSVRPAVKAGDTVHAWGKLQADANEPVELMADGITIVTNDKQKTI